MKSVSLVATHRYFGIAAQKLRDATGRVVARVQGVPDDRAMINLEGLAREFGLSAAAARDLADRMVHSGLLRRMTPEAIEFGITTKFRMYAQANFVDPIERKQAQPLIDRVRVAAAEFNETARHNKYEIEALAVFGDFANREPEIAELSIAVTGRRRLPPEDPLFGRATLPTRGHEEIRTLLENQSVYIRTYFFKRLQDVPRPFSVVSTGEKNKSAFPGVARQRPRPMR